jgi:hypothetical protein
MVRTILILMGVVDDFGNLIPAHEMTVASYVQRHNYYQYG